jgi:hypothetical protein
MFIDAGGAQVTRWIIKRKTVSSNTIYQPWLKIRISYNKPHLYPENQEIAMQKAARRTTLG